MNCKQAATVLSATGDIEAAMAASGHDTILGFRRACQKAGVDLGPWSLEANVEQRQAAAGADAGAPWSGPQVVELSRLWLDRPMRPMAEISRRTGRTMSALQSTVSRFGLPPREQMTAEELATVRREGKIRTCLTCGQQMFSSWRGHRRCGRHKSGLAAAEAA